MSALHRVRTYRYPFLVIIGIVVYAAVIYFLTINYQSVGSSNYLIGVVLAVMVATILPIGGLCNCVFLTVPFTAALKLPVEAFGFMTLMQMLYILRFIILYPNRIFISAGIVIIGSITQVLPMCFYGQIPSNIILLSANLLTFYCTYHLAKESRLNIPHAYLCFSIGVVLSGIAAIMYGISFSELQEYRFSGLWTDPNFFGMFCLIGIVTCLLYGFQKPSLFIILIPMILTLAYFGFLTQSRTFIVVCALITLIICWVYFKKSILGGVLVSIVLIIAIYFALPYAELIFSARALEGHNISNGRYDNTLRILSFAVDNLEALLFGIGYNNTLNIIEVFSLGRFATHNSYADVFLEFGLITTCLSLCFIVNNYRKFYNVIKHLRSLAGIVFCILLFYLGTLSMLKYALLFLFTGTYIGTAQNRRRSNKKRRADGCVKGKDIILKSYSSRVYGRESSDN